MLSRLATFPRLPIKPCLQRMEPAQPATEPSAPNTAPNTAPKAAPSTEERGLGRVVRPYLGALLLAVLMAVTLRLRIFINYQTIQHPDDRLLDGIRLILRSSFWVLVGLFLLLALRQLQARLRGRRRLRPQTLWLAASLASGMSAVNLCSEILVIYRLHVGSYALLFESLLLYGAITLNFLVWYWLVDHIPRYPGQLWDSPPPAGSVSMPYGIVFPEEALERELLNSETWQPGFGDYLYFTILSSNCIAPPEGHMLIGMPIKRLHMLHSVMMMSVFIVILARAINTLR